MLNNCSVVVAGKELPLVIDDIEAIRAHSDVLIKLYNQVFLEYDSKLDRESAFLLMLFLLVEKDKQLYNDIVTNIDLIDIALSR